MVLTTGIQAVARARPAVGICTDEGARNGERHCRTVGNHGLFRALKRGRGRYRRLGAAFGLVGTVAFETLLV